jgi:hypothetical protein
MPVDSEIFGVLPHKVFKEYFENVFWEENVEVIIYGNSYSATHIYKGIFV